MVYLDASVLLRLVLGQPGALRDSWSTVHEGMASAIVEVECLRTLDRLRLRLRLADEEIAVRREAVFRLLEAVDLIEPTRPVLERAAQPFPTELGTLDAIHLATATLWREQADAALVMATHDTALATAARASGCRSSAYREPEPLPWRVRLANSLGPGPAGRAGCAVTASRSASPWAGRAPSSPPCGPRGSARP